MESEIVRELFEDLKWYERIVVKIFRKTFIKIYHITRIKIFNNIIDY